MATSPLTCLSTNLKSIEPYLEIATDFENLYPSVSYLCRFYALHKGLTLCKAEDDCPVLLELISLLTHTSAAFSDETMNQIEDLALKFIEWGDTAPSSEKYNEITFKSFYSAKLLLDVRLLFGELKATTAEKKKCITLKVMNMQESRASLMTENQVSSQKQEKPSSETESSKDDFLLHFQQPQTAQILYLQSKDFHTSQTDLLQETPVGFCEPPRQVFVVPPPFAAFVSADNVSKGRTSSSEIYNTPSVQAVITPSNATTKFDELEVEEKALQPVDVPQTPQTPHSTPAGIPTLGVKQKINMANPGHYCPMQGEPTERNNQFLNRSIHLGNQVMASSPILVCFPPKVHQAFNYPKFNPGRAIVPQFNNQVRYLLHPVTPKYCPRSENNPFSPRCFKQRTMAQFAYYQPLQQSQDHTTQQPSHVAGTSSLLVRETAPAPPESHPSAETATSSASTVKVGNRVVPNAVSDSFPVATAMLAEPLPAYKLAATHKTLLKVTSPNGKLLIATPAIKSVAATPVIAHAAEPVATTPVIASAAKPIATTPVAAILVGRPVAATPVAKPIAATPVRGARPVSKIPVAKPVSATPVNATPVAETLSDTPVKISAPKSVAATPTSANPATDIAIPFAEPVVVTPAAAKPVTTPMSTPVAAIPVPTQVPTPFAVTPVATYSHGQSNARKQSNPKSSTPTTNKGSPSSSEMFGLLDSKSKPPWRY